MGLGPQALNLTLSLWLDGHFKGHKRVVELGSQDLHVNPGEARRSIVQVTKNEGIGTIKTARALYEALGYAEYRCIDTDGRHDALVFDLNEDIRAKGYQEQFDLVTNHGTTEHCFDQQSAFRNVHNLCAKGGLMIHGLPFQGYVNHGFYNYHPNFYLDLAAANGYEVIGMFLNADAGTGDLSGYDGAVVKQLSMTGKSTLAVFAVLRKANDEGFRTPFQGKYSGTSLLQSGYEFQRIPAAYLDLREIAWEMSGRELSKILVVRTWRKLQRIVGFR